MSTVNVVTNNAPTHAIATVIEGLVNEANRTKKQGPPGSIGEQFSNIKSQLVLGNPGGLGAPSGVGIQVDVGA